MAKGRRGGEQGGFPGPHSRRQRGEAPEYSGLPSSRPIKPRPGRQEQTGGSLPAAELNSASHDTPGSTAGQDATPTEDNGQAAVEVVSGDGGANKGQTDGRPSKPLWQQGAKSDPGPHTQAAAPSASVDPSQNRIAWRVAPPDDLRHRRWLISSHNPLPFQATWQRGVYLGSGSFGIAFGYVRLDHNGVPVDHQVVKEIYFSSWNWSDGTFWHGDFGSPQRQYIEIAVLEKLWQPLEDSNNHCLRVRGSETVASQSRCRIITDYCNFGDLDHIMRWYESHHHRIPEAAIWSIIYGLSKACYAMAYGTSNTEYRKPGWQAEQIVHRDIKPDNILLAPAREGAEFPSYPAAILGDWGFATITSPVDHLNPAAFQDRGTNGWMAPEQILWLSRDTAHPDHIGGLSEKTNVWSVGAVAIRLMECRVPNIAAEPTSSSWYRLQNLRVEPRTRAIYSEALIEIAERCCLWRIEQRPSSAELFDYIKYHTDSDEPFDHASGARTEKFDSDDQRALHLLGNVVTDRFVRPPEAT